MKPLTLACCLVLVSALTAWGQLDFESEPINYQSAPLNDRVTRLQAQIDAGTVQLEYDAQHGYLPSVLRHLNVPESSQSLVFSKTSFQLRRISRSRPRAVYFNDDMYVGWVRFGDVIELTAVDPELGSIFYTLDQQQVDKPRFVRDKGQCLSCHASSRTQGVPGLLVRSVFPDGNGQPLLGSGTFTSDHTSPFEERWGGWYVTGTHGDMRHMGNVYVENRLEPEILATDEGANVTNLQEIVDVSHYLSPHSDLVALLVMEHQSQMQNVLTRANFEARIALRNAAVMNAAFERPADYQSESTKRQLASAAERVVKYLLFCDEFELTASIAGTSEFSSEFSQLGPRDSRGRSLRDLDLERRLLRYPCSYLIYSPSFDRLPDAVQDLVYEKLWAVLQGEDDQGDFEHLSEADRKAIVEILVETKDNLPAYWSS